MEDYKKEFIEFLIEAEALKFGEFTLKSGRVAPYFLNMGSFHTGEQVHKLGKFYAKALIESGLTVDVVFGPAYKGIPLSVMTVEALADEFDVNLSYCFNRKEAKDHGEGKILVGAPLDEGTRVVLIDDVITAGTAIRETVALLKENGNPRVEGVLIAMNRMEKTNEGENAIAQLEESLGTKVYSIIDLDDLIEAGRGELIDDEMMRKIEEYRERYGV